MATVLVVRAEPVVPPVEKFTVYLTPDELMDLMSFLYANNVGANKVVYLTYAAMLDALERGGMLQAFLDRDI